MGRDGISVSYRNEKEDVRAAARLAASVVPGMVRVRRGAQLVLGMLLACGLLYGLTSGGDLPALVTLATFVGATFVAALWSSRWFWAFQTTRNPVARNGIGEMTFEADKDGITTSKVGSSGTFAWSQIERIAADDDAVIFCIGTRIFTYVPARALSETDRVTLRQLAGNSPASVDIPL